MYALISGMREEQKLKPYDSLFGSVRTFSARPADETHAATIYEARSPAAPGQDLDEIG